MFLLRIFERWFFLTSLLPYTPVSGPVATPYAGRILPAPPHAEPQHIARTRTAAFRCVAKRPQRNVPKLLFYQVIIARGRIVINIAGVRVILVNHAIAIGIHVHFNARHFVFLGH